MNQGSARPATQAGAFYTADAEALREEVTGYIEAAPALERPSPPVGFISPHAGFRFSGATAGHVYRQLREMAPEVVIVLAPSHHTSFPLASIWDGPAYSTPLGEYPIDADVVARLEKALPGIGCEGWAERQEHSLEVQVPFLQVACPQARLVPLLMGDQDRVNVDALADGVQRALEGCEAAQPGRMALVASSDGFHGYSLADCKRSDARLAQAIEAMDLEALWEAGPSGHGLACGRGPIAVALKVSQHLGATRATILNQSTSADVIPHRDGQWVVGYVAAMFD